MKKLLFIIGVVLAIVGCENKGRGVAVENHEFVGKSYSSKESDTDTEYCRLVFRSSTKCTHYAYFSDGYYGEKDMYYTILSDSIMTIYYNKKQTELFDTLLYTDRYLERIGWEHEGYFYYLEEQ